MRALQLVTRWEVANAAAAVVAADGRVVDTIGDLDREFRLASLTKIATGWAAMIAVEEGTIDLDEPVGQPGCTLRHLLAHAGGYPTDGPEPITKPGRRRIYSNTGIELAAAAIEQRAGHAVRHVSHRGGARPPRHDVNPPRRLAGERAARHGCRS